MNSKEQRVQDAIRSALDEGDELCTPTGSPFKVAAFDSEALKVDTSAARIRVEWDVLEGVPACMARFDRCEVAIGARKGWADEGTLERFLQDEHGNPTMRASYVAPILEGAGVCEILPRQGREKQRIRLKSGW